MYTFSCLKKTYVLAFLGQDYNFSAPLELIFAMDTVVFGGPTQPVSISILDDAVLEGDHSFTVMADSSMTIPPGVTLQNGFSQVIIINDDGRCLF